MSYVVQVLIGLVTFSLSVYAVAQQDSLYYWQQQQESFVEYMQRLPQQNFSVLSKVELADIIARLGEHAIAEEKRVEQQKIYDPDTIYYSSSLGFLYEVINTQGQVNCNYWQTHLKLGYKPENESLENLPEEFQQIMPLIEAYCRAE